MNINRELKKKFNTLFLCLEIIIVVLTILISKKYELLATYYLLLSGIEIIILEILRYFIFGKYVIANEEIVLPIDSFTEKIKRKLTENENYSFKRVDSISADVFVEKSMKSLEFAFVKIENESMISEKNIDEIFDKYKTTVDKNSKKFYNIYIIFESENYNEQLYEKIFSKVYLKPIYYVKGGFSNDAGSFIIPIIYNKTDNKLCFGSCNTYPTFFHNKKEEFISFVEYIIYENE